MVPCHGALHPKAGLSLDRPGRLPDGRIDPAFSPILRPGRASHRRADRSCLQHRDRRNATPTRGPGQLFGNGL